MNGTPRLRSAFPASPTPARSSRRNDAARDAPLATSSARPNASKLEATRLSPLAAPALEKPTSPENPPLIPFDVIDAPSQRLYATALWLSLLLWRLYDFYGLSVDETESLWLFMQWAAIDGVFFYGLPMLHIPWLEWSSWTTSSIFGAHALVNFILMFRVPIPFGAVVVAFARMLWDREIAVDERSVKPADILNNPSLILGRQIINILPEGSAVLNPEKYPLCISSEDSTPTILPIQINQTVPTTIELLRFDFDTSNSDVITIGSWESKRLRNNALKKHGRDPNAPLMLEYTVKKPGLYRLGKVVDETKLEVQHASSEAFVAQCPTASMKHGKDTKCYGELSNIGINVRGTAPLKVKYRKSVNDVVRDVAFQSIQPDDFYSPLIRQKAPGPAVLYGDNDLTWARAHSVFVPLNETLTQSGEWAYSIDEVSDAFGNVVSYSQDADEYERPKSKVAKLEDRFLVLERPRAALNIRNPSRPVQVARGDALVVPLKLKHHDAHESPDQEYAISYEFTPAALLEEVSAKGGIVDGVRPSTFRFKKSGPLPRVTEPGLYTLSSIATDKCTGQVEEPVAFQIVNPPDPQVNITSEPIHDTCAGRNIGLRVAFSFVGTPPFKIAYTVAEKGNKASTKHLSRTFDGPRGQIELRPDNAGTLVYQFTELSDFVYKNINLRSSQPALEQNVKPSVSAAFVDPKHVQGVCLGGRVTYPVRLSGEGPFKLEYEIRRGSVCQPETVANIAGGDELYQIITPELHKGGDYSLSLSSVTDAQGCRESLTQSAKISVRHTTPKAGFGYIDSKQSIVILESKKARLPLRLSGDGPWTVTWQHTPEGATAASGLHRDVFKNNNDVLEVRQNGHYELVSVSDAQCEGSVDAKNAHFDINFVKRPTFNLAAGPQQRIDGNVIIREPVCEGEDDSVDISLAGEPPFDIKYQEHGRPVKGSKSLRNQEKTVPMNVAHIDMNTAQAGDYEYTFSELGDSNYEHDGRRQSHLVIRQKVYARPTASFAMPGKVYSFCQGDKIAAEDSETIPLSLTGHAPFTVDLEIRNHGRAARPMPLTLSNIPSTKHEISIPHRLLQSGNSYVSIRRIRDARGCERLVDPLNSPRVQIAVHDSPSISATEPERQHYCVGERIAFALSGITPFYVLYTFQGKEFKAVSSTPTFRRLAEKPGNFTIVGVQDAGSSCQTRTLITKEIHALPSVRVSKGRESRVDIHAGGSAEITFDFGGTPPFEFTFQRSENAKRGRPGSEHGAILETRYLESSERQLKVSANEEGTYEVVALRDRYCAYALPGHEGELGKFKGNSDRLLGYY